ncbi:MAG: T9SS type A sorting domain-containing protein [Bacteroidota bacterium]|nr:T9SS type A sorting domain-containing protein [Bacteroidota bacterium]
MKRTSWLKCALHICPQARALYSSIYKSIKLYKENCATTVASNVRLQNLGSNEPGTENTLTNTWSVDLFPNPNKGSFSLVSQTSSEVLHVLITDITGKVIFDKTLVTTNFITNLDIVTNAGIYLVTIKNGLNETTTKKLVITN